MSDDASKQLRRILALIPKCADENGVEVEGEHGEAVGGNGGAIDQVAVGAPVEGGALERSAGGKQDLDGERDNFFADAVTGDDGDALGCVHGQ